MKPVLDPSTTRLVFTRSFAQDDKGFGGRSAGPQSSLKGLVVCCKLDPALRAGLLSWRPADAFSHVVDIDQGEVSLESAER